jgi:hypothetical protein
MFEDTQNKVPLEYPPVPHYYGDIARRLFLGGAIVMALSLTLETKILPTTFFLTTLTVIALTILAGLTSPKQRSVILADTIVAAGMFVLFEYFAVYSFSQHNELLYVTFAVQQILALNFLVALYFCSKTWRGMSSLTWI